MKVDFATYCCEKDRERLEANFNDHVESHGYAFDNQFLIYQRCMPVYQIKNVRRDIISRHNYHHILINHGIEPNNIEADRYTHGWTGPHYWQHHCVNHLTAIDNSDADYIVLADADCYILNQKGSWVEEGIKLLKSDKSILVVSPSDGTKDAHKTQTMSQQVMLVDRKRFMSINFDLPFEGFKEGGPFQEYYFMLEGRVARYMEKHNLYRYMLSSQFRYKHSQW